MDNEVSNTLIKYIEQEANIKYQLVSPGDHRDNPAERAIKTFKAHFIAILSGADPNYPLDGWDLFIPQAIMTLNFLQRSRLQPKISAYTLINGQFNFNATPLAPAGCKIIIHDRKNERKSWARRGTPGFYISPAMQHYRNYTCHIPSTNNRRVSNTLEFFPTCCELPATSATDRMNLLLNEIKETIQHPTTAGPSLPPGTPGTDIDSCLHKIGKILTTGMVGPRVGKLKSGNRKTPTTPPKMKSVQPPRVETVPTPRVKRLTRSNAIYGIGTRNAMECTTRASS